MEFNDKQIEIILIAEKLFAEEGFDGASVRAIAKEAGVNIAMISYYFGSKEKLLEAIIMYRTSGLSMQLDSIIHLDISPLEKIDRLVDLYISRINKNKCMYQIVHFEMSSKRRIMDMSSFTETKRKNMQSLQFVIDEGQQQGIFRKDVNVALIPPTIMGTYFHFHMNRPYFETIFNLTTDEAYESYIANELTTHIQQTIKALLAHEN